MNQKTSRSTSKSLDEPKKQELFDIWEKQDLGKSTEAYQVKVRPSSGEFLLLQTTKKTTKTKRPLAK